jgi:hypothetical protein
MVARGASQKRRRSATPAKGWIIMATLTAGSEANPRARRREQRGWVLFYEISERGTSWLGAVTFATVNELTGSYRAAILSLVAFFVVGFGLLAAVNVRRAIAEAGNPQPERV